MAEGNTGNREGLTRLMPGRCRGKNKLGTQEENTGKKKTKKHKDVPTFMYVVVISRNKKQPGGNEKTILTLTGTKVL